MKKSLLIHAGLALAAAGMMAVTSSTEVSAHGFVEQPASRGYQGKLDSDWKILGWSAAFEKYGAVIDNPQGLEAKKGFPQAGPADGHIASADGVMGDYKLDNQTPTYWTKHTLYTGKNNFTWNYTAAHATAKWHYYITKNGWDQNKPLTRDELQLIGEVKANGETADKLPATQSITIPSDHLGYHVILAVWDVYDTPNAFYSVIDANIQPKTMLSDLEQ